MPGPKEQSGDQIQHFMWVFVNELIRLYEEGFVVHTKKYPEGWHVQVILVGVICDKLAAHKLGGFGSHSHTHFCHRCWISLSEKQSAAAFQSDSKLYDNHHIHWAFIPFWQPVNLTHMRSSLTWWKST